MLDTDDPALHPTAAELAEKRSRLVALCERHDLAAVLLTREASFAWATGGGTTRVAIGGPDALAALLVTRDGTMHLLADAIEAPRLAAEAVPESADATWHVYPWEEDRDAHRARVIQMFASIGTLGADAPVPGRENIRVLAAEIRDLRGSLTDGDVARYRWLGQTAAHAVEAAARAVQPGMTEHEIAASYVGPLVAAGAQVPVALVATDARLTSFRHPLPTEKRMERHALLVATATRWGLHASVSRAVYLGTLPDDLRGKQEACASVDAAYIAATRAGVTAGAVFAAGAAAYAAGGYPEEWRKHHQGGAAGFSGREWVVTPDGPERVVPRQAFAYNPTITGTKSEDTFVLDADGPPDFLTHTGKWPAVPGVGPFPRPAILERP